MKTPVVQTILIAIGLCSFLTSSEENPRYFRAEQLFQEGLYQDAAFLYEQILSSQKDLETDPSFLTLRVAECKIELGLFKEALQVFELLNPSVGSYKNQKQYLLGIIYRKLGQPIQALSHLSVHYCKDLGFSFCNQISFERGLCYLDLKKFEEAKECFASVQYDPQNPSLYERSRLHLTRIAILTRQPKQALVILDELEKKPPLSSCFCNEMHFLRGLAYYSSQNIEKASEFFKKAVQNEKTQAYHLDSLYFLAQCQLKIAELNPINAASLIDEAEAILEKALSLYQEERFYIALGHLYILKAEQQDPSFYHKAQQFLSNNAFFKTAEGRKQAKLLLAHAFPTYRERRIFYTQLLNSADESELADLWVCKGLNDLNEGLQSTEEKKTLFQEATEAFAKAVSLYKKTEEKEKTNYALKMLMLSFFHQRSPEKTKDAWTLLSQVYPNNLKNLGINSSSLPSDFYPYLVHFASWLKEDPDSSFIFQMTENKLKENIEGCKEDKDLLLKELGNLYFNFERFKEADATFRQLIDDHPDSTCLCEAWVHRALCAEKLDDKEEMQHCFFKIYTLFPESLYAPIAYFRSFSQREYLTGNRKALKHLQQFENHFPHTPLLIHAHYLMGLDLKNDRYTEEGTIVKHKNLPAAIDHFQKAEELFDQFFHKGMLSSEQIHYLRLNYRAKFERAMTNFSIAEESHGGKQKIYFEYAKTLFKEIEENFHKPNSPYFDKMSLLDPSLHLFSENRYWMAKAYLKSGSTEEADKMFEELITEVSKKDIQKNYFLSRAWFERALIEKTSRMNPDTALLYFSFAEKTSSGLSPDEKLNIWIEESECQQQLGQYDAAMRLLSKVINEDVVSSLRLKAMFLRAKLYDSLGKTELAYKQLESLSKQQGEWGKRAKDLLEVNHGIAQ